MPIHAGDKTLTGLLIVALAFTTALTESVQTKLTRLVRRGAKDGDE